MKNKRISFKFLAGFLGIALCGGLIFPIVSPNQDLHFFREIPTSLSPELLNRHISAATRWPQWFYSLDEAQVIERQPSPGFNSQNSFTPLVDQTVKTGSLLLLKMDPKKGKSKRFNLLAEVLEYSPEKVLRLKIVDDSSHRLTSLFDRLEWKIELNKKEEKTWIQGSAIAHTLHWRARFFGQISEKILMNQVFYPNLTKLSSLKQPFQIDIPFAQFNPTGM